LVPGYSIWGHSGFLKCGSTFPFISVFVTECSLENILNDIIIIIIIIIIILSFIHSFIHSFIQSSCMGPQPEGWRTCQNSCNINKATYVQYIKRRQSKNLHSKVKYMSCFKVEYTYKINTDTYERKWSSYGDQMK